LYFRGRKQEALTGQYLEVTGTQTCSFPAYPLGAEYFGVKVAPQNIKHHQNR
jgi:hypothetical protein